MFSKVIGGTGFPACAVEAQFIAPSGLDESSPYIWLVERARDQLQRYPHLWNPFLP
jgi:hypothetical protein